MPEAESDHVYVGTGVDNKGTLYSIVWETDEEGDIFLSMPSSVDAIKGNESTWAEKVKKTTKGYVHFFIVREPSR